MNMISTGSFLTEMDASNKQETLAEKFAAVWEKKNAKAARAGGVSLMALSLAACGSSSDDDTAAAPVEPTTPTTPVTPTPPAPVALSTSTDVKVGTELNDTFTGTSSTYQAADVIIDQSSTDSDVLNLTLTAAGAAATVSGIEAINVTWDAFGAATIDAANISGAAITVSSSKLGYLGNTVFNNTGSNTVTAGSGAIAAMDVNGGTAVVVNATNARTVTVDGSATAASNVSASVTAGASTTTIDVGSATAFIANTIVGGAATTSIEVNGTSGLTDSANITVVKDGTVAALTAEVETVTIQANAGQTVTLANASLIDDLTIVSSGAVTLVAGSDEITKTAMAGGLTDSTSGLTINLTSDGAADLSLVQGTFDLQNALAADTSFASGANIKLDVDMSGAVEFLAAGTGTTDVLNMAVTVDQSVIDVIDGTNDVETLKVSVAHAATETDGEIDFDKLTVGALELSGASKVKIGDGTASATDDFIGDSIDANALTGELNVTESSTNAAVDITVVGSATAKNTMIFATTSADTEYTGGAGVDIVTMAQTTGNSTVVLGNGANTYTNTSLTDGNAVVLGGTGVDTITFTVTDSGADTATITVQSGDGADDVTVDFAGADETADINLGGGDDTFTFGGTATGALDVIVIAGGAGTDSIDLNGTDISLGTITLSEIETIDDSTGGGTVDASLLTGKAYNILGNGSTATLLDVVIGTAGTFDFSGLVINNTLTDGIGGLSVTTTGADTLTGTSGTDTFIAADAAAAVVLRGGNGQDTYTLDDSTAGAAGTATIIVNTGESGLTATTADTITTFETGVDTMDFNIAAGTALNYVEASADLGATNALGLAAGKTAADAAMDGTVIYYLADNTNAGADHGYLFVDADADGTADFAVILSGLTALTGFDSADIIA